MQFQKVLDDDKITDLAEFQRFLYYTKKKNFLGKDIYDRIRPTSAVPPTLYGLPKLHKKGYPCRPNLASKGSCYTYEGVAWLNEILAPLREHPTDIKDTFDLVSRLSKINLSRTHMASIDVISLYKHSTSFAIDVVLQKIYSNSGVMLFHDLNKTQYKKLLTRTTKNTTSKFNHQYYKQINGVALESFLAPILADVCINWIVDQTKKKNPQPIQFYGYVDHCFASFSK